MSATCPYPDQVIPVTNVGDSFLCHNRVFPIEGEGESRTRVAIGLLDFG